jgi:hypothetical protein
VLGENFLVFFFIAIGFTSARTKRHPRSANLGNQLRLSANFTLRETADGRFGIQHLLDLPLSNLRAKRCAAKQFSSLAKMHVYDAQDRYFVSVRRYFFDDDF